MDPAGSAVGGVDVMFRGVFDEGAATADSSGNFSLELASGRYEVRAVGDRLIGRPQPAVQVLPGFQPLRIKVIVERLATLQGTVVDHTDTPVPDATVHFVPTNNAETALAKDGLLPDMTEVDSDGRFEIDVRAVKRLPLEARAGFLRGQLVVQDLSPGDIRDDLVIVLPRGIEVSGKVVDPSGRPVANAEVSLYVKIGATGKAQLVETDSGGRYAFAPMAPGAITLEARADGFAPSALVRYQAGAKGDVSKKTFTLTLQESEALAGRVVDVKGDPLGDVRIRAGRRKSRFRPHQTHTNSDGEFEIVGVDRTKYWLSAVHEDFANTVMESIQPPREDLEVVMVSPGSIRGKVMDNSGQPLPSFVVRIDTVKERGVRNTRTNGQETRFSDGTYELERLVPGHYGISIAAPGHQTVTLGIDVTPGNVADGSAVMRGL